MKTSVNKLKNLMSTIIGCVVLIFAFFFVGFDTTTMTISASYNGGYLAAIDYVLSNQPQIMVYDYTPKFSESSVTALSATTCELGSSCSVTPLSYYDYEGNLVNTVSNIITYNGEEVERIDTTRLGTYKLGYKVVDSSGNETIVYRDVIVEGDNTKTIMITIMITTLLSTVLGIGTYYFIKRRKSYLN